MTKNEKILRATLDAFMARDLVAFDEYLHPDVVWHDLRPQSPIGGGYRGKGEVLSYLAGLLESTGGSMEVEVHDLLAGTAHAVVLLNVTAQRAGKALDDRAVFVVAIEGEKVREVWAYAGDPYALDEFWA